MVCMAFCTTWQGLAVCRTILGIFEGQSFSPSFLRPSAPLQHRARDSVIRLVLESFSDDFPSAGFFPGCVFLITTWYKRSEVAKRLSLFVRSLLFEIFIRVCD